MKKSTKVTKSTTKQTILNIIKSSNKPIDINTMYLKVLNKHGVKSNTPFSMVMKNASKYPSFRTVESTTRKLYKQLSK